jgi:hypothetical protein
VSSEITPLTKADWLTASPFARGYITYMYANWPGSEVPKDNPYDKGTPAYEEFERGQAAAVLSAQDSEG